MSEYPVRHATHKDDELIESFINKQSMDASLQIKLKRDMGFYDSLKLDGDDHNVLIMKNKKQDKVLAMAIKSKRRMQKPFSDEAFEYDYLHGLRIDHSVRKSRILARGYRLFGELVSNSNRHLQISSILKENTSASQVLTSGRAGLPHYHSLGEVSTHIINTQVNFTVKNSDSEINSIKYNKPKCLDYWRRYGKDRLLFPYVDEQELNNKTGPFLNFKEDDFLILKEQGEITATAALQDIRPFKQWEVSGYSKAIKLWKPVYNMSTRFNKRPPFPQIDQAINYRMLSWLCPSSNESFEQLLSAALNQLKAEQVPYLMLACHESDPIKQVMESIPHYCIKSTLFSVSWQEIMCDELQHWNKLLPYIELSRY